MPYGIGSGFSSAEAACLFYLGTNTTYAGTIPYTSPTCIPEEECTYCLITGNPEPRVIASVWRVITCPEPSVYPDIKYTYQEVPYGSPRQMGECRRTIPDDVICPLPEFPDINDSDACTKSLEKGAGKDVDNVCPDLNPKMDPEIVKQEQCLAAKIRSLAACRT